MEGRKCPVAQGLPARFAITGRLRLKLSIRQPRSVVCDGFDACSDMADRSDKTQAYYICSVSASSTATSSVPSAIICSWASSACWASATSLSSSNCKQSHCVSKVT